MTAVWCVRANYGQYTKHFLAGGYAAIGWLKQGDLSHITHRDELYPLYRKAFPQDTSNIVIGQQVGQIARFLLEIKAGDVVMTPAAENEYLHHGRVASDPSLFYDEGGDGCPYHNRRRVVWKKGPVLHDTLSLTQRTAPRQPIEAEVAEEQEAPHG